MSFGLFLTPSLSLVRLSILVGLVFFRIHKLIYIGLKRERRCTLYLGPIGERLSVSSSCETPFPEQTDSVISKDTELSPF